MQNGIVYRSTGSWYEIKLDNGKFIKARIKGKFRTKQIRTTNPIAVGDFVEVTKNQSGEFVVSDIKERKNYIIRKSVNLSKEAHIIASNIDLAILLITISSPVTSPGFIDRFTVTAEAYNIPLLLVFNKIDIYNSSDFDKLNEYEKTYNSAGYNLLRISANSGVGIEKLKHHIKNKTTLIAGNSGAGKSTLINQLIPSIKLKTGDISASHMTGKHTTTFAEMFDIENQIRIIDTPGIKGFGLVDFDNDKLSDYFVEFSRLKEYCKFKDCNHINEPNCMVKKKLNQKAISVSRYKSYVDLHFESKKYR